MNVNPKYNPIIHHRRSIRLKGYDYSQAGLYFVTICVQDRECLFGEITNRELVLNDAGTMIEKWYYELENKFSDIKCHEMVVMPNHFHCIVENVGADLRVCPNDNIKSNDIIKSNKTLNERDMMGERNMMGEHDIMGEHIIMGENDIMGGHDIMGEHGMMGERDIMGEHIGSPLHRVVQWFKTMSTNEYIRGVKNLGWQPFNGKLWQRNYYEHIIRNDDSYHIISDYIINNPTKWTDDKFYSL